MGRVADPNIQGRLDRARKHVRGANRNALPTEHGRTYNERQTGPRTLECGFQPFIALGLRWGFISQ